MEHVVLECNGFDTLEKLHVAESSKAVKVKSWLEEYRREQGREKAREQGIQLDATQKQAMLQTDVWSRQIAHQETSDTNKGQCVQSSLDTHGNFDRCDEAQAKTITAAITVFLVGCAIPFTIVESSFFIKMIETLNSGYLRHLPKDNAFRRTHLLTLFNDTIREINELWQVRGNPLLTMGFDGYTGENSNLVVNITEQQKI